LPIFIPPFFLTDAIITGEELGWRGYVLPRLQVRYSALVSSLIVGVIWAIWHIPTFLAPGNTSPLALFMVKIITESVLYTWLYNNTRGSLLLVTLFHTAGNTAGIFLPVATTVAGTNVSTLAIQVALEVLVASVVILTQGPLQLSRTEPNLSLNEI
jgi:membrane protease YdiL (CAAX protease family)